MVKNRDGYIGNDVINLIEQCGKVGLGRRRNDLKSKVNCDHQS